jgi:hypothetical protein
MREFEPDFLERSRCGEETKAAAMRALLTGIKAHLPELEALEERVSSLWVGEDCFYRFHYQSFKVYSLQGQTLKIVAALAAILPERPLQGFLPEIVAEGTGRTFSPEVNQRWTEETRPILEAFFHAREFLRLIVHYGRELEYPALRLGGGADPLRAALERRSHA